MMGKNFRNEGISVRHNPEFTSIEFYQAYATVEDMIDHTERLLNGLYRSLHDGAEVVTYHPSASDEVLSIDLACPSAGSRSSMVLSMRWGPGGSGGGSRGSSSRARAPDRVA